MDVRAYNREKWNKQVEYGNPWTIPVSPDVIAAARKGEWSVLLTEIKRCRAPGSHRWKAWTSSAWPAGEVSRGRCSPPQGAV